MMFAAAASAAVLTDALLGEPRRAHPLAAFGRCAQRIETLLHPGVDAGRARGRLRGALALVLAVAPIVLACAGLLRLSDGTIFSSAALQVAVLYFAIGHRSLREHAQAVLRALRARRTAEARRRVGLMVSRDTGDMDEPRIAAATVESVLENGSDAIFGALFWFALGGAPGALAYRLVNTLDAMWGYRTPRYRDFGWAAARLDDALNWAPARLTALSYALLGARREALRCWRTQAGQWDSPNGGPVMASGAGALGLQLGGPAMYRGVLKPRPVLGAGPGAQTEDIPRSLNLVLRTLLLWLAGLWIAQGVCAAVARA